MFCLVITRSATQEIYVGSPCVGEAWRSSVIDRVQVAPVVPLKVGGHSWHILCYKSCLWKDELLSLVSWVICKSNHLSILGITCAYFLKGWWKMGSSHGDHHKDIFKNVFLLPRCYNSRYMVIKRKKVNFLLSCYRMHLAMDVSHHISGFS